MTPPTALRIRNLVGVNNNYAQVLAYPDTTDLRRGEEHWSMKPREG